MANAAPKGVAGFYLLDSRRRHRLRIEDFVGPFPPTMTIIGDEAFFNHEPARRFQARSHPETAAWTFIELP